MLLEIDLEQKDKDQKDAMSLGHTFRNNGISGYIQGITLDNIKI